MHLRDGFHSVTCGDEVVNGKPAPDCFLAAAEKLNIPPADCLVIEDAPAGVESATAAGMRVVVVPSLPKSEYGAPDSAASIGLLANIVEVQESRVHKSSEDVSDYLVWL